MYRNCRARDGMWPRRFCQEVCVWSALSKKKKIKNKTSLVEEESAGGAFSIAILRVGTVGGTHGRKSRGAWAVQSFRYKMYSILLHDVKLLKSNFNFHIE